MPVPRFAWCIRSRAVHRAASSRGAAAVLVAMTLGGCSGDVSTDAGERTGRSRAEPPAAAVPTLLDAAEPPAASAELGAGSDAAEAPSPCPADMALVHGWFCPLLVYACTRPVDVSGYRCAEYSREPRCLEPPDLRRYCIDRHEWPNRVGENPQVYVDFDEAAQACAGVGKRLCRRSEWVLACEGPKRLPYPWGFRRQPSPCNIDRAAVPFDAMALERPDDREEELARLWQADPIGSHPDCVSAFGVYDLAGNVDEWTDNRADNPHTKRPTTLNGGYWGPVRDTCRLTTKSHGPRFRFYQVGFRCCRDPLDGLEVGPEGPIAAPRPWLDPDPPDTEAGGEYAPAPVPAGAPAGAPAPAPAGAPAPAPAGAPAGAPTRARTGAPAG